MLRWAKKNSGGRASSGSITQTKEKPATLTMGGGLPVHAGSAAVDAEAGCDDRDTSFVLAWLAQPFFCLKFLPLVLKLGCALG